MTNKKLKSKDFKTVAKAIRDTNKPEVKQPEVKRKIPRGEHTLRVRVNVKGGETKNERNSN